MKFLIPTQIDDSHVTIVKQALEAVGHNVTLLFTTDQPTRQKNTVHLDNDHYRWQSAGRFETILENDHDVVWWRGPRKPHVPKHIAHPDDYSFVVRENVLFYESLTHNLASNAWWVNSKEAANRANFNVLQLKIASECGLTIPTTLCSNDPEEIRLFILQYQSHGIIHKPLSRMDKPAVTKINYKDLPANQWLQRTPAIFQKEVKKHYELRVVCFGEYLVAAKLTPRAPMVIESYVLPDVIASQIRALMFELGLVFGVCELIVTPENDYIFLDINEQGAFLWMEDYNPDFKLLDMFVNFLQAKTIYFNWEPKNAIHALSVYRQKARRLAAIS